MYCSVEVVGYLDPTLEGVYFLSSAATFDKTCFLSIIQSNCFVLSWRSKFRFTQKEK